MGKGRILTAHGEGRYTLEIVEDRSRAESTRALAIQRVARLGQDIADIEQQLPALQQAVEDAADEQDQAIAQHQQDRAEGGDSDIDLAAYAVAVMEAASERDRARILLQQKRADCLAAQSRIDHINALPPLRQIDAWCADYTEDLAGEVATAEVPGEVGQVVISPGFEGGNQWSATTDGVIQPALSGTPASVFYNLAMLPGWQKWRPTFRIATVSNVNNDLCDISLDMSASSQQGLGVNSQSSYSGVPIMYMDCNGDAFADGDRVLVAFSGNADRPVVVGFEQAPRTCQKIVLVPFNIATFLLGGVVVGGGAVSGDYPPPPGENYATHAISAAPGFGTPPALAFKGRFEQYLLTTTFYPLDRTEELMEAVELPFSASSLEFPAPDEGLQDAFPNYSGIYNEMNHLVGYAGPIDTSSPIINHNIRILPDGVGAVDNYVLNKQPAGFFKKLNVRTEYAYSVWYGYYDTREGEAQFIFSYEASEFNLAGEMTISLSDLPNGAIGGARVMEPIAFSDIAIPGDFESQYVFVAYREK